MEATENGLQVSATNLEIFITCKIPAEIREPGTVAIPAHLLTDLVGALPSGELELDLPEESSANTRPTLTLTSVFGKATIRCMSASEFPSRLQADEQNTVSIEAALLKAMIAQVAFAAASDGSRPIFTSVLMRFNGETLTLAAADAFRLATQIVPFPTPEVWNGDLLVPARTLSELAKLLPGEGTVQISASPHRNLIVFQAEGLTLGSRLIEGTYPNYQQIIPESYETQAVIETKLFATLVRSVAPFATDNSNIIRLTVMPGANDGLTPGLLRCEAHAEDVGSADPAVAAIVTGVEQKVTLNVKYVADMLAAIDTTEVTLEIKSPQRPCIFRPAGGAAEVKHLIMPMTTNH
jgi:DNA polymerase-3 subunit beta